MGRRGAGAGPEEVLINSPSWGELLAEGRKLDQKQGGLAWEWGDWALAVTTGSAPGQRDATLRKAMEEAEIGSINFSTMLTYMRAAEAWPLDERVQDTNYTSHLALANHPNRFSLIKPGMSYRDAQRAAGNKASGVVEQDPEKAAEILIKNNPEIVGKALAKADPTNRTKVSSSAYKEARYPGLTDEEIVKLDHLDDKARQEVQEAMAPIASAVANIGAIMWTEPMVKFHAHVVSLVENDATLETVDVKKVQKLVRMTDEELTVYCVRHGIDTMDPMLPVGD
jgi:hypothetical protein